MVESDEIRARARAWRDAADASRDRARRVLALGDLRWDAPAADAFRAGLRERASGLHRLADAEDDVAAALDEAAVVLAAADAVLAPGAPPAGPRGRWP